MLFILTDDQGWGDVSSHGNPILETPNIDRLAAEGVRFDRFFVSPVCAPTRASFLTGKYSIRVGANGVSKGFEHLPYEEVTVAEILKGRGYATGCFGKWHNGKSWAFHPNQQGFDTFIGHCSGGISNYFDAEIQRNGEPYVAKGYITDALAEEAIRFIDRSESAGKPFFCYLSFNAPHTPLQVPDRYFEKYLERTDSEELAAVYGMVDCIDENIGRVLRHLDEIGASGDTLVIFSTDNGANTNRYNDGMKGYKGSLDEGGSRVPFFIRYPERIVSGGVVDQLAAHIDFLPTVLDLCGIDDTSGDIDGRSLVPWIEGAEPVDRTLFTHFRQNKFPGAVRTKRYRLVIGDKGIGLLYDMWEDPLQENPIQDRKPGVARELFEVFESWIDPYIAEGKLDTIPVPLGFHEEEGSSFFYADSALFDGDVRFFKGFGYNSDWLTGWAKEGDTIAWDLSVEKAARFGVELLYVAPAEFKGTKVEAQFGDSERIVVLDTPVYYPTEQGPDRYHDRYKTSTYRKWAFLDLGEFLLEPGRQQVRLRIEELPDETKGSSIDIRAICLSRNLQKN